MDAGSCRRSRHTYGGASVHNAERCKRAKGEREPSRARNQSSNESQYHLNRSEMATGGASEEQRTGNCGDCH